MKEVSEGSCKSEEVEDSRVPNTFESGKNSLPTGTMCWSGEEVL